MLKSEFLFAFIYLFGLIFFVNSTHAQNEKIGKKIEKKSIILKDHDTLSVNIQIDQDHSGSEGLIEKPTTGDLSFEANLNITGATTLSLSHLFDGIKARYFFMDNSALRVHINFQTRSNNYSTSQNSSGQYGEISQTYTSFGLGLGMELHKDVSLKMKRLSPYVGADLMFEAKSSSEEWINYDGIAYSLGKNIYYSGAWANGQYPGGIMLGLRFVTGFDYYIYHRLLVGIELGYGFQYKINATVDRVESGTIKRTINGGSQFLLGSTIVPGIRIGYVF